MNLMMNQIKKRLQLTLYIVSIIGLGVLSPLWAEEGENHFQCVKEVDHTPKVSEEAEALYQEARALVHLRQWEKNRPAINMFYRRAAKLGHWKAKYNLAANYLRDKENPTNRENALDLIEELVAENIPLGIYAMAIQLDKGEGVVMDKKAASHYMHRAAELGNPEAQYYLGRQALSRLDLFLGRSYLQCALAQGHAEAGHRLAMDIAVSTGNYPLAAHYYMEAGKLGYSRSLGTLREIFNARSAFGNMFGYGTNAKLHNCFNRYQQKSGENPFQKFPELPEACPLPLHPVMGDGSEYPDVELRLDGFLRRLKTRGHDPEWEERMGKKRLEELRGGNKQQSVLEERERQEAEEEAAMIAARPKVTDLPSWVAPHVQVGEFFVKYQSIYFHLIDSGLEKKIESPIDHTISLR